MRPAGCRTAVVLLAAQPTDDDIADHVAAALGLLPTGSTPATEMLADLVHTDRWLIVLDNCEHVLRSARMLVAGLLGACPDLTVVATSRQPLGLPAEARLRLRPLALPPSHSSMDDVERSAAGRLFLERARHVQPNLRLRPENLAAVTAIVRHLDGLPLAIELAAGRLGAFTVDDLQERLGRALVLLRSGAPTDVERHSSLRATLQWSYQLLDDHGQQLLSALALFPDGFTLDAAERVGSGIGLPTDPASTLAHLVDTSLIEPLLDRRPARYRMLETVRGFALEALDGSGRRAPAEAAQTAWAESLVGTIAASFGGPGERDGIDTLWRELANLRAVHDRACAAGDRGTRRTLVIGLVPLAMHSGVADVPGWSLQLAEDIAAAQPDATVFALASNVAVTRGDLDVAEAWARRSLATSGGDATDYYAWDSLSTVSLYRGQLDDAITQSIAATGVATALVAHASMSWGVAALAAGYAGSRDAAAEHLARGAALADECGSPLAQTLVSYVRGELLADVDPAGALVSYERTIALATPLRASFFVGIAAVGLASLQLLAGRTEDALATFRLLIEQWLRIGSWTQQWTTLRNLAGALAGLGDHATALALLSAADRAPAASALDAEAAERNARHLATCRRHLGDAVSERITTDAASAGGRDVVALALSAIDRAITAGRWVS